MKGHNNFDAFKSTAKQVKSDQHQIAKQVSSSSSPPCTDDRGSDHQGNPNIRAELWTLACLRWIRRCSVAVLLLVVAALVLRVSRFPERWAPVKSPGGVAGSYLRQIAAVHDWKPTGADIAHLQDLQATLTACAQQLVLPEVKVPQHIPGPAWFPPKGSSLPAVAVLDLNCSNPGHAAACEEAAASNSYEGAENIVLAPEELADLLMAPVKAAVEPYDAVADPLSSLSLNCEQQTEACMDAADLTNAYEHTQGLADSSTDEAADQAAQAEAAAYLSSNMAGQVHAAAWDALIRSSNLQESAEAEWEAVQDQTNSYEGVDASAWQYKRQAEEAGAHYLDVAALDLDCSPAAASQDASTHSECVRSRGVNRYEAGRPDAAADSKTEHPAQGQSAGTPAAVADHTSAVATSTAWRAVAAHKVEARRQYYKCPCNSPAAHRQYKNPQGNHVRVQYYKNPANAPAPLDLLLPQPKQALETTAPASGHLFIRVDTILACKGLWVAIMAVLLASCWCFDGLPAAHFAGWLHAAYQALQGLCGKMMWPVPPVCRSGPLVLMPCASQELPAPQLMQVEVPLRSTLPVLSALASTCTPAAQLPAATPLLLDMPLSPTPAAAARSPLGLVHLALVQDTPGVSVPAGPTNSLSISCLQDIDDIQAGLDSPRALSRAGFRRSVTPMLPGSRVGTPAPTTKGD